MNYKIIISRGSVYINKALENWDIRKHKLMKKWHTEKDECTKLRINFFMVILENRINAICRLLYEYREKQKEFERITENQFIHLECKKFECKFSHDAVGTGVRLKDYEHGKYKCYKCGGELVMVGHSEIDEMLMDKGIRTAP